MCKTAGIYKLLQTAGSGAFGTVYLAENSISGQRMALKILDVSHEKRELAGLIRYRECRHANLLQIHHIDRLEDGRLFYTMDIADNRATAGYEADTLAARGRITAPELTVILHGVLNGVETLHQHNLLHRDIKPENILFINGVPTLGDIGLTSGMISTSCAGTPQYLPPDVITGKRQPDQTSDLFALSRVAYTALTGNEPFRYPELPPDLSPEAANILEFCRIAGKSDATIAKCRNALNGTGCKCRIFRYLGMAAVIISAAAAGAWANSLLNGQQKTAPVVSAATPEKTMEAIPSVKTPEPPSATAKQPDKPVPSSGTASPEFRKQPQTASSLMGRWSESKILSLKEFKKALADLERQYGEIPAKLAEKAKKYYRAEQDKFAAIMMKSSDIEKQAEQRERLRILDETDKLYRLGSTLSKLDFFKKSSLLSPHTSRLRLMEHMYKERNKLADLLAEKNQ